MIIGVGTDLVDIRRIQHCIERFGSVFCNRIYTQAEQIVCESRIGKKRFCAYAMRFAAKEACSKALGTGIRQGVFWRDMENGNLQSGQPVMNLKAGALRRLNSLIPEGFKPQINVSLTDEYPYAMAFVIISAELNER